MIPHTKAEKNQMVTAIDIEQAIAFIQHSVDYQLERLQFFVDSALLAVEQVQDKRIELLEHPPEKEVTIYDVFFDMVFLYCWQAKVVEPIIKKATKSIVSQLLKRRAIYNMLPRSEIGADIIGNSIRESNSKQIIDLIIRDHVLKDEKFTSKEFEMFSNEVVDFVKKAPDNVLSAGKKGYDQYKKIKQAKPLGYSDTPSVAVLNAAQSYMRNHRLALKIHQTEIIKLLRAIQIEKVPLTKDVLNQFLLFFKWDEIKDYEGIREKYKLIFEGVIWSQLYHWKYGKGNFVNQDQINNVPDKLREYFYERFRPILINDPRIGPYDKQSKSIKNQKLKLFFDDLAQIKLNQVEIDKAIIVVNKKRGWSW